MVWAVAVVLVGSIAYSAVLANRPKQPQVFAEAVSPCLVTNYNLALGASSISAMVVCTETARYRVSAEVTSGEDIGSGGITVRLAKDLPSTVNITFAPQLRPDVEKYQVRFIVGKM